MHLLLAATIAVTANFYEPDESLEVYTLETVSVVQDAPDEVGPPSLWWRAIGWAEYIACGAVPISTEYRKDRSTWEGTINNPALNSAAWLGSAQGLNMTSELMRKKDAGKSAWAMRVGTLTACAWTAGYNFRQGFFHE